MEGSCFSLPILHVWPQTRERQKLNWLIGVPIFLHVRWKIICVLNQSPRPRWDVSQTFEKFEYLLWCKILHNCSNLPLDNFFFVGRVETCTKRNHKYLRIWNWILDPTSFTVWRLVFPHPSHEHVQKYVEHLAVMLKDVVEGTPKQGSSWDFSNLLLRDSGFDRLSVKGKQQLFVIIEMGIASSQVISWLNRLHVS